MKPQPTTSVDVTLGIAGSRPAPKRVPHMRRRLDPAELRLQAFALRRRGMSYRRIAAELRLSYSQVSVWLDGPEPEPPAGGRVRLRLSATLGTQRVAAATRADAALRAENRALGKRLDELGRRIVALEETVVALEARLRREMKQLFESLSERIVALVQGSSG